MKATSATFYDSDLRRFDVLAVAVNIATNSFASIIKGSRRDCFISSDSINSSNQ